MDAEQHAPFDRLPAMMIEARQFARSVDQLQQKTTTLGSTRIAHVQNMRSILGGLINDEMQDAELVLDHFPAGKIHIRLNTGEEFVLKSDRFRQREVKSRVDDVPIDGWDFDSVERVLVTAVFYDFGSRSLVLRRARTEMVHEEGKWVFYLLEPVELVGEYPYADFGGDDDGFAQDATDDFEDLNEDFDEETGSE